MGRIVTFYSYKGGVGRTFALANVAVLLARRGKRVLLVDWDLEAPGLLRYFKPYISQREGQRGLVHLLQDVVQRRNSRWQDYVQDIRIEGHATVSLLHCGDEAPDYVQCVRTLSWHQFFEKKRGGAVLDEWRSEWKRSYDFTLIDSRTGITDSGGICTVFLPDIVVLVFAANDQSFSRGVEIALGVQEARRGLAVPRPPVAVLPLPGRFDGRDEVDEARDWLGRFARGLKPFYDDWLPKQYDAHQMLEVTKVPYVAKFSFGEPLPVVTHSVSDPEFPGFYLDNVARLLASDFEEAAAILNPKLPVAADAIAELRAHLARMPIEETEVMSLLGVIEQSAPPADELARLLHDVGVAFLRDKQFIAAESVLRRSVALWAGLQDSDSPGAIASLSSYADLLKATGRLSEAESAYYRIMVSTRDKSGLEGMSAAAAHNLGAVLCDLGRAGEATDV